MRFRKYLPAGAAAVLASALSLILWITLFSRLGTDYRRFYPPFWSYRAILNGNMELLLENIGNVILLIPVGMIAALYFRAGIRKSLLIGLGVSLLIECCQWFLWLGSFEIDDLLHNTVGAGVGAALANRTRLGKLLCRQIRDRTKSLRAMACVVMLLISLALGYQGLKRAEMKRLAVLNNREDGAVNLLVLSPAPVYIGQTDVSVSYNADGSLRIAGKSDSRAWICISKFTLPDGAYVFEGLSGVDENTVGLELAAFDRGKGKYVTVGREVGAIDALEFELRETSKMEALISLYPGWEGSLIARPVIYQGE